MYQKKIKISNLMLIVVCSQWCCSQMLFSIVDNIIPNEMFGRCFVNETILLFHRCRCCLCSFYRILLFKFSTQWIFKRRRRFSYWRFVKEINDAIVGNSTIGTGRCWSERFYSEKWRRFQTTPQIRRRQISTSLCCLFCLCWNRRCRYLCWRRLGWFCYDFCSETSVMNVKVLVSPNHPSTHQRGNLDKRFGNFSNKPTKKKNRFWKFQFFFLIN